MQDKLLDMFFDKNRWETALKSGVDKDMDKTLLRKLTDPLERIALYHRIRDGNYHVAPPHEARIPKDDGSFRTVYANDGLDRIVLSIINDMLFELCPDMIHPTCKSYQKGIGCGKIVQDVSSVLSDICYDDIGYKIDLSKYFDSVPIEYIDKTFDEVEQRTGKSSILDFVREYYHMNTVLDINTNPVEKYSSLRQGCAIAAFLADAVLFDIDNTITSDYDVYYVRYSDDILIIGNDKDAAFNKIKNMLAERGLTLNPKKVERLSKNRWFRFLGFSLKGGMISLSESRVKTFQKEIEKRTIKSHHTDPGELVKSVHNWLYAGDGEYSWSANVLPIINVQKDIQKLNGYVMDAIRAGVTKRTNIGGLGFCSHDSDSSIQRGTGRHVKANKQKLPKIDGYLSILCMKNALLCGKNIYVTLLNNN